MRGEDLVSIAFYYSQFWFYAAGIIFLTSMTMIAWFVRKQDRLLKLYYEVYNRDRITSGPSGPPGNDRERMIGRQIKSVESRHQLSKVIYMQALAYLVACLITQGNIVIATARKAVGKNDWLKIYYLVSYPLQGLFNLAIFLGHKVYSIRRIDPEISILRAIGKVFQDRTEPLFIFTQISLVQKGNIAEFDDGDDEDEVDGNHGNEDESDNEDGRIARSAAEDVISYDDSRKDAFDDDDTSSKKHSISSALGLSAGSLFSFSRKSDAGLSTGSSSHLGRDAGLSTGSSSYLGRFGNAGKLDEYD